MSSAAAVAATGKAPTTMASFGAALATKAAAVPARNAKATRWDAWIGDMGELMDQALRFFPHDAPQWHKHFATVMEELAPLRGKRPDIFQLEVLSEYTESLDFYPIPKEAPAAVSKSPPHPTARQKDAKVPESKDKENENDDKDLKAPLALNRKTYKKKDSEKADGEQSETDEAEIEGRQAWRTNDKLFLGHYRDNEGWMADLKMQRREDRCSYCRAHGVVCAYATDVVYDNYTSGRCLACRAAKKGCSRTGKKFKTLAHLHWRTKKLVPIALPSPPPLVDAPGSSSPGGTHTEVETAKRPKSRPESLIIAPTTADGSSTCYQGVSKPLLGLPASEKQMLLPPPPFKANKIKKSVSGFSACGPSTTPSVPSTSTLHSADDLIVDTFRALVKKERKAKKVLCDIDEQLERLTEQRKVAKSNLDSSSNECEQLLAPFATEQKLQILKEVIVAGYSSEDEKEMGKSKALYIGDQTG